MAVYKYAPAPEGNRKKGSMFPIYAPRVLSLGSVITSELSIRTCLRRLTIIMAPTRAKSDIPRGTPIYRPRRWFLWVTWAGWDVAVLGDVDVVVESPWSGLDCCLVRGDYLISFDYSIPKSMFIHLRVEKRVEKINCYHLTPWYRFVGWGTGPIRWVPVHVWCFGIIYQGIILHPGVNTFSQGQGYDYPHLNS